MIPFGDRAVRLALPAGVDRRAALERLAALPGVHDVVLADDEVALWHAPGLPPRLDGFAWPMGAASGREHVVPVTLDGPDLPTDPEWADALLRCVLEVHFLGFQPGFAYLGDLPDPLRLTRRSTPRPRVHAGALAVGGHYVGIYPNPSPGGWNLVGNAPIPAVGAWTPGDRVRLVRR